MPSASTIAKVAAAGGLVTAALLVDKKQFILRILNVMESVESIGYLGPVQF